MRGFVIITFPPGIQEVSNHALQALPDGPDAPSAP
jgi:hypothetical protein